MYLADMCGDGLTDWVRLRNGEVCFRPLRVSSTQLASPHQSWLFYLEVLVAGLPDDTPERGPSS